MEGSASKQLISSQLELSIGTILTQSLGPMFLGDPGCQKPKAGENGWPAEAQTNVFIGIEKTPEVQMPPRAAIVSYGHQDQIESKLQSHRWIFRLTGRDDLWEVGLQVKLLFNEVDGQEEFAKGSAELKRLLGWKLFT